MTGLRVGPAIRRLAVAVRACGGRPEPAGESTGLALALVEAALRAGELTSLHLTRQVEVDGTVLLFAVGVDEPGLIGRLVGFLRTATRRLNARRPADRAVRIRVAGDEGLAMLVAGRFVGEVVETARLLCAGTLDRPATGERAAAPDVEVLLTPRVRRDLGDHDRWRARAGGEHGQYGEDSFAPVRVRLADGRIVDAWSWRAVRTRPR
ncbi:hypothetical protein [Frankia sp. AgB32]|uniref:hypothetical protein n=1 Tax=Frankia sp. AgB32 TaxID=631119 RepID=UPI00200CEBFD|nr:hypothetical protein [Frankia sp. AgB32]